MDSNRSPKPAQKIIAIAGGSGSGKTWLAQRLIDHFQDSAVLVSIDWYYKDLSHLTKEQASQTNFDHPDAIDTALLFSHIKTLIEGHPIEAPSYDFSTYQRNTKTTEIHPSNILLIEGLHALWHSKIRQSLTHSVFIDVPSPLRLARRIRRDQRERGYPPQVVLNMWHNKTAPMHQTFVAPTREHAQTVWSPDHDDSHASHLIKQLSQT